MAKGSGLQLPTPASLPETSRAPCSSAHWLGPLEGYRLQTGPPCPGLVLASGLQMHNISVPLAVALYPWGPCSFSVAPSTPALPRPGSGTAFCLQPPACLRALCNGGLAGSVLQGASLWTRECHGDREARQWVGPVTPPCPGFPMGSSAKPWSPISQACQDSPAAGSKPPNPHPGPRLVGQPARGQMRTHGNFLPK